jgi:hypothetical protein
LHIYKTSGRRQRIERYSCGT